MSFHVGALFIVFYLQGLDETYLDATSLVHAREKALEEADSPSLPPPSLPPSTPLPPSPWSAQAYPPSSFAGHLYRPPSSLQLQRERGCGEGGKESTLKATEQLLEQRPRCRCGCVRRLQIGSGVAEEVRRQLYDEVGGRWEERGGEGDKEGRMGTPRCAVGVDRF